MAERKPKEPAVYEKNRAFFSVLGNRIYFVPRSRVVRGSIRKVVGKKYDITDDLQPLLLKKFRKP